MKTLKWAILLIIASICVTLLSVNYNWSPTTLILTSLAVGATMGFISAKTGDEL
jgi:hypothetical protein